MHSVVVPQIYAIAPQADLHPFLEVSLLPHLKLLGTFGGREAGDLLILSAASTLYPHHPSQNGSGTGRKGGMDLQRGSGFCFHVSHNTWGSRVISPANDLACLTYEHQHEDQDKKSSKNP